MLLFLGQVGRGEEGSGEGKVSQKGRGRRENKRKFGSAKQRPIHHTNKLTIITYLQYPSESSTYVRSIKSSDSNIYLGVHS